MPSDINVGLTPGDQVHGAVQNNKVSIFIKIKNQNHLTQVAMPSDINVDPTPCDELQCAVQINEVMIFINI